MSVWRTSYLIYGFKLEESELDVIDDHYEDITENEPLRDLFDNDEYGKGTIVYDGMCGLYTYIGVNLASIDEDSDEDIVIPKNDILKLDNKLSDIMKILPSYLLDALKDKEPKLYFFVHTS